MSLRTGRRVSADKANLPAHGKKIKTMNTMNPGVTEAMKIGDGDPTDCSDANDGSKAPAGKMEVKHKGPDRTK